MRKTEDLFITGEDLLIDLVKKEKKISIHLAASKLGVSPEVIEDWAVYNMDAGGILRISGEGRSKFIYIK